MNDVRPDLDPADELPVTDNSELPVDDGPGDYPVDDGTGQDTGTWEVDDPDVDDDDPESADDAPDPDKAGG